MRLISWNVNGIRAALRGGLAEFFAEQQPEMLAVQEVKARPEQVDFAPEGYRAFWNSAAKPGYSGTAVWCRREPLEVSRGVPELGEDSEGRVLRLTFRDFHLVNTYVPNAKRDLSRLPLREKTWDPALRRYLKELEADKPVVVTGDFNVAHEAIDLANPKANRRNAGFTDEERAGFSDLLAAGFVDTFRHFNQEPGHYTWWSYRNQARARNIGWRIDYFVASKALIPHFAGAGILPAVRGSDHCPIYLDLADSLTGSRG